MDSSKLPPFSVLLAVYAKENPTLFKLSMESLVEQTLQATEVVLVCDGPLTPELESVISEIQPKLPLKIVKSPENMGFGKALQLGMKHCQYELIARADTDDISLPNRFEIQIPYMVSHPDLDILGTSIYEYEDDSRNVYTEKLLPLKHKDILSYAKWRNPMNHMSVVFKASAVARSGGYSNYRFAQDYHLWVSMLMAGCKFENLPNILVLVSAGRSMVAKRGGFSHFKNEFKMQKDFVKLGFLSPARLVMNAVIRLPVRLLPDSVRRVVYLKILRK